MIIQHYLHLLEAHGTELAASLTLADLGIMVGILSALMSALVNLVYTWRKDRREQRESDAAWARHQKER
jgi:uncharacterized membrane protein (DUF485 family)